MTQTSPSSLDQDLSQPLTVLCVEANAAHSSLIRQACLKLQRKTEVIVSESLEEAMAMMKSQSFDLILADCSGDHADLDDSWISELKSCAGDAPIAVLSCDPDQRRAIDAIRLGASDYIVKSRKSLDGLPKNLMQILKKAGKAEETKDAELPRGDSLISKNLKIISNLISQPSRFYRDASGLPNLTLLEKEIDSIKNMIKNLMTNK